MAFGPSDLVRPSVSMAFGLSGHCGIWDSVSMLVAACGIGARENRKAFADSRFNRSNANSSYGPLSGILRHVAAGLSDIVKRLVSMASGPSGHCGISDSVSIAAPNSTSEKKFKFRHRSKIRIASIQL